MQLPGLADRLALVTGGANGIGREIVRRLAEEGARVVFVDLDETSGAAVAEATGAIFRAVDLRDEAALDALCAELAELGGVDILVNNAAVDHRNSATSITSEFIEDLFRINLFAQFYLGRSIIPQMRAKQRGAIVNLTSLTFHLGQADVSAYAASKGGIIGLTRVWARENGPFGIRANAVAPGWVNTDRQRQWLDDPATREWVLERQCLKRLLQPAEVADAVLFLCSDLARAITGQVLTADCGWVHNG